MCWLRSLVDLVEQKKGVSGVLKKQVASENVDGFKLFGFRPLEVNPGIPLDILAELKHRDNLSCFARFKIWLCKRFGCVPSQDFDLLVEAAVDLNVASAQRFNELVHLCIDVNTFAVSQADFDKRVAERLHLNKSVDEVMRKDGEVIYG